MDRKTLRMKLRHRDYFHQILEFRWPEGVEANSLSARVTVVQPYGFRDELTTKAHRRDKRGELEIEYPLIDEGRYSGGHGRGLWELGRYRFELELKERNAVVGRSRLSLDPNRFFGKIDGMELAQVDSLRQFIECCADRAAYIDCSEIGFTIRTLPDRVYSCEVEVDVVEPKIQNRLTGPLRLDLTGEVQHHAFDGEGWSRGEYWLRVRALHDGRPVGPYLVRQFWIETSFELRKPELPLRIGDRPQFLVDDWIFASSSGLRREPDQLEPVSDGPMVQLDRPWEKGSNHANPESFAWDSDAGLFRMTYYAGPISDDPKLLESGGSNVATTAGGSYLCLAVSSDGVRWEKPELGLVEFDGSKRNNILKDAAEEFLVSGESDSYPLRIKERPMPRKYRYRFYDAKTDGPVDMDRFVFRYFTEQNMEPDDQFERGFRPGHRTFWGLERRGDDFLALTRRPVLRSGQGMGLQTTTERASTYPFEGERMALFQANGRSTCTFYDRRSKTFYYYYRPNFPPYPPNGLPYYLWHRIAAIRTRAVMWTRDGIHWDRRHMFAFDEHDTPGTILYGFGFLRPSGHLESDMDGQMYLGTLFHWDLRTQATRHELVWSRDHIHWHRFGNNRKHLLACGPVGSWNASNSEIEAYYCVTNVQGEEEWWFPYSARRHRYMLHRGKLLGIEGMDAFKAQYPYFQLAPFFTNWEDFFEEVSSAVRLPALARCKAGRLAHTEPLEKKGEFTTHPLVSEGGRLLINARTDPGGSVCVAVQDAEGNTLPGFSLEDCLPFSGDRVAHEVRWKRARLEEVNRRVIRLRMVLEGACLYTFRIAS